MSEKQPIVKQKYEPIATYDPPKRLPIEEARQKAIQAVTGLATGPRALRLYMESCVKCGTCAQVCPVYYGSPEKDLNPAHRSDLMRNAYKRYGTLSGKLLKEMVGAKGINANGDLEKWAKAFYECTGCRRCAVYCPMGIDNSVITRKGRAICHTIGLTPPRLIEVTRLSLETGNTDGVWPNAAVDAIKFLEEELKDETGKDIRIPIDEKGAEMFYVPPSGDLLVNPEASMGVAKVFHKMGISWTMSSKAFDGANYGLFTGDDAAMKQDNKLYIEEAKRLGVKSIAMGECGHAYRIMKFMCEKMNWWGNLPFKITNVIQLTAKWVQDGMIKFEKDKNPEPVTYHDPCNFARSCGIYEEPRIVIKAACADYREMTPGGPENWCCGGGGGLSAMDSIREFRMTVTGKKKVEQVKATGATYVASPCSNCKRQFGQLMEHYKLEVGTGGLHDLVSRSIVL
jgi:Fe-S oxidoreductase